jgi:hypothetical protein
MEYTPIDISKQFPKFAKSSVRRVLQELLADNKLIRETRGHYNFNDEEEEEPPTIYRKILKIGASCAGKFKLIFAITFEDNEENRESELLAKIELDFKSCVAINYDGRELYSKKLKRDIEFGYAEDKTDDNFNVNEFYPNIRTGEEMI